VFRSIAIASVLCIGFWCVVAQSVWDVAPRARAATAATTWRGRYVFAGGDSEQRLIVTAIDTALTSVNPVARAVARDRLLEASAPYARLRFEVSANEIRVSLDDHAVVSPRSGEAVRSSTPTGLRAAVRQRLDGRNLVQVLHTRSGTRQNHFRLSADGTRLAVDVRIAADRLPEAIEYTLSYRRAE
jgi:hypothetical protein